MRFTKLTLRTSAMEQMIDFYRSVLELPVREEDDSGFSVQIGSTLVHFQRVAGNGNPFYHFAINIPENRWSEAKQWAKARVSLNKEQDDDEVFFVDWNAHAFYFEDPAGNIVELIARHNLDNAVHHPFSSGDLLEVSEIGIVAEEVIPLVRRLNELGIPNWRGDSDGLTPVGVENGLLIVVKQGRRWFFADQAAEFYPVEAEVEGLGRLSFEARGSITLAQE
ncbi:VOC family protein [Paenibacillus turpanensis]|uniref:VOC family protein n=1 Tax=Paenibacillus turpanensis TaxID=2689078 RepID=UPI00140915D2|nr:VOC family protein [Paenibacillus turpanensis]